MSNTEPQKQQSQQEIRTFAAASFLNDLGSDMIYPVWPMFVTTMLGGSMTALGFLDGIGLAIVSFSQAASGYLADRYRRRKIFIWMGYLFSTASRVGFAFSTFWTHLIPFRILDRAGKMRSAPRDAHVSDLSINTNRAKHFGFIRAMDHGGAIVGVCLCIWLFEWLGYRMLFILAAVPSIIGSLAIAIWIRERGGKVKKAFPSLKWKQLGNNYKRFLIASACFALATFSYSFLLLYAREFGYQKAFIPVFYLLFTVIASATSIPFGRWADRFGRKRIFMISQICWGAACILLILTGYPAALWLCFVLYGIHLGALEPVQKTLAAELSPPDHKTSGIGIYQMCMGLCALPASLLAGFLWDSINMYLPLLISLIFTTLSVIILTFVKIQ